VRRGARTETVPREAAAVLVEDPSGRSFPLEALWAQGPVVLAFLRHFG
jgi:hypothetical protein